MQYMMACSSNMIASNSIIVTTVHGSYVVMIPTDAALTGSQYSILHTRNLAIIPPVLHTMLQGNGTFS